MKIKYKIALSYSISAIILLNTFAILAYYLSSQSRQAEYLDRLEYRARSIANVIIEDNTVKVDLLRKLDKTTFQDLYKESILVYNLNYDLLYSNMKDTAIRTSRPLLDYIKKYGEYSHGRDNGELVGVYYTEGDVSVIVLVSSLDKYGYQNLQNLKRILIIEIVVAVIVLVIIGYLFARKMVQPIDKLVTQVKTINANNLQGISVEARGKDEIAQLGANFNTMLQRLSDAFDLQKSFVNNASHELRTPLASIISQLQVALSKDRTKEVYADILASVLEDAENLSDLSNGLLQLAQSELNQQKFIFSAVRMDELLLEMGNLVKLKHIPVAAEPQRGPKVDISFLKVPDQDTELVVQGNESLLKVLFLNLLDNAFKFSADNTARVTIDFFTHNIQIQVRDNGIGIAPDELNKVFEPFYRGANAHATRGHGLGLSICKKIVQLHKGHISASSAPGKGTVFTVILPHA
ncbi:HAMP domain-containing sensor histidine kinase [Chitinophaga sancti]|uniref:histidine kinase n=1 Tax=Chitinophaga sancti TaxID=1004 RepID=A0A1K1NBF8_9BACT|nr:HAMP domain-containing sensor histidine kinase [Chitinophaga sancti]WQD63457.1 HAMP domain-containing sensor histidine kinase [Chitinophaga sancti]WQG90917.1 HAMP domain-containing sensor histidine kinase [Chitinophaga sancti]SFW31710.1 Signal transduction histidine kinase [Chitinophaga sancti]